MNNIIPSEPVSLTNDILPKEVKPVITEKKTPDEASIPSLRENYTEL